MASAIDSHIPNRRHHSDDYEILPLLPGRHPLPRRIARLDFAKQVLARLGINLTSRATLSRRPNRALLVFELTSTLGVSRHLCNMQDLLLYSLVPATRQNQVLQILAGVTASQPATVLEQHLVYEQLKLPPVSKKLQSSNNQRRTFQHLIRTREDSTSWRHRTTDVPEPGLKQVISQSVSEAALLDTDLEKFRPGSDVYRLTAQYFVSGTRFVQGNVVVVVSRICREASPSENPVDTAMTSNASLIPALDPSGSYVVEACVRVENGSTAALRDQATKELLAFAESLKGAVDLRVPDRLALDPRLKVS